MKNFIVLALLALLVGCSSAPMVGERRLDVTSNSKPSWVNSKYDMWDDEKIFGKDPNLHFKVLVPGQYDLNMGMEVAKAMVVKEISEKIYMRISTELGVSMVGNSSRENASGKYIKSAVAGEAVQVELMGFGAVETYWERYVEYKYGGVTYNYDIYRKFVLSKDDYAQAKQRILDGAMLLAREEKDRKAEVELTKLFEKNVGYKTAKSDSLKVGE